MQLHLNFSLTDPVSSIQTLAWSYHKGRYPLLFCGGGKRQLIVYEMYHGSITNPLRIRCLGKFPSDEDALECLQTAWKLKTRSVSPDQRFVSIVAFPVISKWSRSPGHITVIGDSEGICTVFGVVETGEDGVTHPDQLIMLGEYMW
jgi:hypothetical protein